VVNIKGEGHTIDLDVDVPAGRIQDFLRLAVKTHPAVMTGVLTMKTRLHIRPGKESVTQKLGLKGTFTLKAASLYKSRCPGQGGYVEPACRRPPQGSQAWSRGRDLAHDRKDSSWVMES